MISKIIWRGMATKMQQLILQRSYSVGNGKEEIINRFWKDFYMKLGELVKTEHRLSNTNVDMYHNAVIDKLEELKNDPDFPNKHELFYFDLQKEIEDLSINFDEDSLYKHNMDMINLLISDNMISAKDFLKHKKFGLSEKDLSNIHVFGQYTLEAIIIHVLGSLFNCLRDLPYVRVSTLIDQLDSAVRVQAAYIKKNMCNENVEEPPEEKRKVSRSHHAIGIRLVEFMCERSLISLKSVESESLVVPNNKGYYPLNCYAMCNFDLSILPIKLNLPMVYPPFSWATWKSNVKPPTTLSEIKGGYISSLTGDMYNGFRLLTSRDYDHFHIKLNNDSSNNVCDVLNSLQSQAFEINTKLLEFIHKNRKTLEDFGILMNQNLSMVNPQKASDLLRICYFNDKGVMDVCSCKVLLQELVKRVQRARYERFVLILAEAYKGYKFYLPAFMDFRGRIYRAGVLHFHERDLSKSLIQFASNGNEPKIKNDREELDLRYNLASAAAFKYKKFQSIKESVDWYLDRCYVMRESDKSLINFAQDASDPFQFIAKVLSNERVNDHEERIHNLNTVPVTQDASASAYQIMSYLLLNAEMGMRTNLLPSPDNKIQDLYLCLKDEALEFLHSRLDNNKYSIIQSRFSRKLVKTLFMPLIYGKTVITMVSDIRDVYGSLLSFKDNYRIAQLCYEFWKNKYPDIANLMKLINLIGWFCSVLDKPVRYGIPYFTTVQDYMRSKKADIWVYDRVCKKRRRITLRVPTLDRDRRKSQVSTCVNFIHQKDAFIAMKVVDLLKKEFNVKDKFTVPVYTVHDNFITTSVYAHKLPQIYTQVFTREMGSPLLIINKFINMNLRREFPQIRIINNIHEPIPGESLRILFLNLMPHNLSLKDRLKWDKNVEDTVSCYEEYVHNVCGEGPPSDGGRRHIEKWNSFNKLIQSWETFKYNYSLHY